MLDPEYMTVIEKLIAKGIRFVACSGRQFISERKLFAPIRDKLLYITDRRYRGPHTEGNFKGAYLGRIRDTRLKVIQKQIGTRSKTDYALMYNLTRRDLARHV